MPGKALIPLLVAMMIVTGVFNTIITKYQDMQCVGNCDAKNPKDRQYFEQPIIQTLQMFMGEMLSWIIIGAQWLITYMKEKNATAPLLEPSEHDPLIADNDSALSDESDEAMISSLILPPLSSSTILQAHERQQLRGWKVTYLAIPALCDITGTTLMNVGMLFVAASIFQMTRGALVLFVGLLSVTFLRRPLALYKWFALFAVFAGVLLVGLAGTIEKPHSTAPSMLDFIFVQDDQGGADAQSDVALRALIGILIIVAAQIFIAVQFVAEEKIMERYSLEPIKALGWEGLWGFSITTIGMLVMYVAYGRTEAGRHGYFDAPEGFSQLFGNKAVASGSFLFMLSICGFNFFGLSVTRSLSATSRSTIDTSRTLFIWLVSLGLGWESFKWLQVLGFALLVYGTFLYNDLISPPLRSCITAVG